MVHAASEASHTMAHAASEAGHTASAAGHKASQSVSKVGTHLKGASATAGHTASYAGSKASLWVSDNVQQTTARAKTVGSCARKVALLAVVEMSLQRAGRVFLTRRRVQRKLEQLSHDPAALCAALSLLPPWFLRYYKLRLHRLGMA